METAASLQSAAPRAQGIVAWAGQTFGIDPGKVIAVLRDTCFRVAANEPQATDAEVAGLMVVARAHNLNPFLKEIYAFRDKKGGIMPVVGVDGWARVVNDHKALDGIEFAFDTDTGKIGWCECTIYRKDRTRPTIVREYFEECRRDTGPWKSHPRRMLRHKAMIQCARVAFSFSGIYDEDEAARILETQAAETDGGAADRALNVGTRSASARIASALGDGSPPAGTGLDMDQAQDAQLVEVETRGDPPADETQTAAPEKPAKDQPRAMRAVVAETVGMLQRYTDIPGMTAFMEALPAKVKGHDDVTRAYAKRLGELKAKAEPSGMEEGSPAVLEKILKRIEEAKDTDVLALAADEGNIYEWAGDEKQQIAQAYAKRLGEIEG